VRIPSLIRKFRALAWPDRAATVKAAVLLLGARAALKLLPFRTILDWAEGPEPDPATGGALAPGTRRLVHAIDAVGHRLFPRDPCLTQAVLVQRHLRTRGHPSELRIGVRKGEAMTLEAHAWVECGGEVVIGSRGMAKDHVPLPTLSRRRPGTDLPPDRGNPG
jgi:hypothetical protein